MIELHLKIVIIVLQFLLLSFDVKMFELDGSSKKLNEAKSIYNSFKLTTAIDDLPRISTAFYTFFLRNSNCFQDTVLLIMILMRYIGKLFD